MQFTALTGRGSKGVSPWKIYLLAVSRWTMSNNLPAKQYSKSNPTVTRLSFEGSGDATKFIDIARALSAVNRRFYRQGVYYYVNSIELYNSEDAYMDIHTLPDTWVTKNAWNRAFKTFQKMNSLVDTPRPKYHDFKVFMNHLHKDTGDLNPDTHGINGAYLNAIPDEWIHSFMTSADDDGDNTQEADNFYIHMLGPHVGSAGNWESVGAIKSYSDSRREPDQTGSPYLPPAHVDDPLMNMFDMSSEEMLNDIAFNLDNDNDQTPYNADLYLGESDLSMTQVARLATTQISGRVVKASGFCAPLGLICVDPHSSTNSSWRLVISLAQGTYKGVYAERA